MQDLHGVSSVVVDGEKKLPELYTDKAECCGCAACRDVCPKQAIDMREDEEGFLYPAVDEEKCIRCNRCVSVCAFKTDQKTRKALTEGNVGPEACPSAFYKDGKYDKPIAYAVKHKDDTVRAASMSGGAFTALSDIVLAQGGSVFGCVLEDNRRAVHTCAESKEERDRMRSSKYIQSETADAYREAKRNLEQGRLVLYSGTSCQIAGLRQFLGKPYENLICVDIVCHGVPSPLLWRTYLDWRERQNGEKIISAVFRNKKDYGWKSHVETLTLASGKIVNSRVFAKLFYQHAFLRPCCYHCPYKDVIHPGDITIADCWGVEKVRPEMNDNKGLSLVLINEEKGRDFFEKVKDSVDCVPIDVCDYMQSPLKAPFPAPANREKEWADFRRLSFDRFVQKRFGPSLTVRVKRKIKSLLH